MANELATVKQIDEIVDQFLNYDGGADNYAFDGGIMDMVDYTGSSKSEMSKRAFQIRLRNPNPRACKVYLLPSLAIKSLGGALHDEGRLIEGIATVTPVGGLLVGETKLDCTCTNDVQEFIEKYINDNPSYVACLRIASNVPDMYTGTMLVETYNPFDESKFNTDKTIRLADYENDQALRDNFIKVTEGFEANPQKRVSTTVPANSLVTITMYFGLIMNQSKGLAKTIERAVKGNHGHPERKNAFRR